VSFCSACSEKNRSEPSKNRFAHADTLNTAVSLAQIKGLQEFSLHGLSTDLDLQGLFDWCTPESTLKELHISGSPGLSVSNAKYVAQMLSRNPSIETLYLNLMPEVSLPSIAQGLVENTTLQTLEIFQDGLSTQDTLCFPSPLKDCYNCTLESLILNRSVIQAGVRVAVDEQVEFYLRLNKDFQRKRFFSPTATYEDLVNIIIEAKMDTAAVFYFLSEKTSILWGRAATQNLQSATVVEDDTATSTKTSSPSLLLLAGLVQKFSHHAIYFSFNMHLDPIGNALWTLALLNKRSQSRKIKKYN
jgi:hypothetical protein